MKITREFNRSTGRYEIRSFEEQELPAARPLARVKKQVVAAAEDIRALLLRLAASVQ